ncbi:MAG: stage 0 sporulation family protein [Selenomonadaceae bacterium]|nr:stage 0 sporulation family protein [Selenomonadaceae bacterium]MBQ7629185.1 stage 0 sporulation family protein [Selenomonadaceae bacterium]
MQKIIGVRFKKAGKIHLFDPGEDEIEKGDSVIVDTSRGLECGEVVIGMRELPQAENPEGYVPMIRRIHRKATRADLSRVAENRKREEEAFEICKEKIAEHRLPMNLINVRYTFDVNKIIFYFTAEGRVDFRMLVRDLAYIFKTRIELRQVGVREEAKNLGGVGCCGRKLCCTSFLGDFAQVSIRMAKEQNLSLNPTKISGICGRLLCCLKFESDYYHECYVETHPVYEPRQNDRVIVDDGEGRVVSLNLTRRTATIILDSGKTLVSSWEELLPVDGEVGAKFPDAESEIETVIDEFEQPIIEEPKPAPPDDTKKLSQADDEYKDKPWINRPRKPRRPRGKFR